MKPTKFDTITGSSWEKALPEARARRKGSGERRKAQLENHANLNPTATNLSTQRIANNQP